MSNHFANDIIGETTFRFLGCVDIDARSGPVGRYVRFLTFTVNHREDFRNDTVDVAVESPDRPRDRFDIAGIPSDRGLPGILAEIHDYTAEQERRLEQDGQTVAQRVAVIEAGAG